MSKRVLIVTRAYYPHNSAASHRAAAAAKFLPEFGWTPVVMCAEWTSRNAFDFYDPGLVGRDPCEVVRVAHPVFPCRAMLRLSRWGPGLLFPHRHPRRLLGRLRSAAARLLAPSGLAPSGLAAERFDAVLASAPPTLCLTAADGLSRRFGVPWVADLRDLPDELDARPGWPARRHARLQSAVCRSASALVTVTPPLAERLGTRYPGPVHVVYNGYDPDDFAEPVTPEGKTFDVVYCGAVRGERNPRLLLDALDELLAANRPALERVRVRFHGVGRGFFSKHVGGRPCARLVTATPRIPHAECIRLERRAAVLLLLSHRRGLGVMTSKVFEYLGAERPILSVPGDGGVTDTLLEETGAGRVGRTPGEIAEVLLEWLDAWERTGRVPWHGRRGAVAKYTRRRQAGRLARVLDEAAGV